MIPLSIKIANNLYLLFKETKKMHVLSPIHVFALGKTNYLFLVHPKGIKKVRKQLSKMTIEFKVKIVIETGRHGLFQLIGFNLELLIQTALNVQKLLFSDNSVENLIIKNLQVIVFRIKKEIYDKLMKRKTCLIFVLDSEEYTNLWIKFQFSKVEAIGWSNKRMIAKQLNLIYIPLELGSWTLEKLKEDNFKSLLVCAFIFIVNKGHPKEGAKIYLKHTRKEIGFITQNGFCRVCSKSFGFGFVEKFFLSFNNAYFINSATDGSVKEAILVTKLIH